MTAARLADLRRGREHLLIITRDGEPTDSERFAHRAKAAAYDPLAKRPSRSRVEVVEKRPLDLLAISGRDGEAALLATAPTLREFQHRGFVHYSTRPNFLAHRRFGSLPDNARPITFSPDYPVGAIGRTAWKRAVSYWNAMVVHLRGQPADTEDREAVRQLEEATLRVFDQPSPTTADYQAKIKVLAMVLGCAEPGTIHALEDNGRHFLDRLLCRLANERVAPPTIRKQYPPKRSPAEVRADLEAAVERAIAALDAFDGDPDYEDQCEDEGHDSDSEPDNGEFVGGYADDGHGGENQLVPVGPWVWGNPAAHVGQRGC